MPTPFDPTWEYYAPDPEVGYAATGPGWVPAHARLPLTSAGGYDGFHQVEVCPRASVTAGKSKGVTVLCDDLFRVMWRLGFTAPQIAAKFGVCVRTVRTTRERLALPRRRTTNRAPRYEELMDADDRPLAERSGTARRDPYLSLGDATNAISWGQPFGDVFPDVDPMDHAALREWFCGEPKVPTRPLKNQTVRPTPDQTGDVCSNCGGGRG